MTTSPPSVGSLRAAGVTGAFVSCADLRCGHAAAVSFGVLRARDDEPFPALRGRHYRCTSCGGVSVSIMPDWPPRNLQLQPPTWAI